MENRTRPRHGKQLVERRKYDRFRVQQGGFISLYPYFAVLGQIMDMGSRGLAFRYLAGSTPWIKMGKEPSVFSGNSYSF